MTLYDEIDREDSLDKNKRKVKTAGYALMSSLKQAIRKGRLFCGMTACAQLMSSEPTTIMLCVLPHHANQVSVQIKHTLIRAFCNERGIPIIQVGNHQAIEHLINKVITTDRHSDLKGEADDLSCLLIKHPPKGAMKEDKILVKFYMDMIERGMPVPDVDLPA